MSARASALGRRLRDERGITLVMVTMFMLILGIVGVAVSYYTTSNSNSSSRALADQKAFGLAETGFSTAYSILASAPDATSPSVLPTSASPGSDSTTYPGGTVEWWGSYDSATSVWTIWGRGTVKNPAGQSNVVRLVSQQATVSGGAPTVAANPGWGYIYADNEGAACVNVSSSVQIAQPIYLTGDLCMNNSAKILAAASPVTVGGTITTASSSMVGESGGTIALLHVGGGCRYQTGPFTLPCTATHRVWATAQDTVVGSVTKPPIDVAHWYANAKPGPTQSCTAGSFPGGFDNDSTLNRSRADVDLFVSSYDCTVTSGATQLGRIAYDSGAKTLFIDGVVFFDGNIVMATSAKVLYSGRGSIYASGKIDLQGSQQFCAKRAGGACDWATGAWDPEVNLLVLVAGGTTYTPDVILGQSMMFQGALYASTDLSVGSSVKWQGPMVANNINLSSSSQAKFLPFDTLPDGTPGVGGGAVTLVPGTWSG